MHLIVIVDVSGRAKKICKLPIAQKSKKGSKLNEMKVKESLMLVLGG